MGNNNWDVSEPIDHILRKDVPQEIRDVKSATKSIIAKEHAQPSTSGAGGQHLQGAVRVYLQSKTPTSDPEGNNLSTADTSDNGRLSILTGSSNIIKVYAATSAGISTGWQAASVSRVYASEAIDFKGFNAAHVSTGTQSGQVIHIGQLDTSFFSLYQPATSGMLKLKQTNTPTTFTDVANKLYVDDTVVDNAPAVYDSDWFSVTKDLAYTKAHGLGVVPDLVQVLYSNSSDGSGHVAMVGYGDASDYFSCLADLNATNVIIRTGANGVARYRDSGGTERTQTSGYLKVVAVVF